MIEIKFQNNCRVEGWMLEDEKEFRLSANEFVTSVIQRENIFHTGKVTVSFFNNGVASVVALISSSIGKIIMKTCFKPERGRIESLTFKKWNNSGIRTPRLISEGELAERSYFLMEYIEAPTVREATNDNSLQKDRFYSEIGLIFSKVHSVQIEGFGPLVVNGDELVGKYKTLKESVSIEINKEINEALEKLTSFTSNNTIGHFDFGPHHFFATNPLTVFDPDPEATLPIIDVAAFLIPVVNDTDEKIRMRRKVLQAYMENSKELDFEVLSAALVLRVHQKAHSLKLLPNKSRNSRADFILSKAGSVPKAEKFLHNYF